MAAGSLPLWLQYIQALAIPITGSFIAMIGAWVAWQQMQIAHTRLRHDLNERRFRIFEVARAFLTEVVISKEVSEEALRTYLKGIIHAPFVLDDDTASYLTEIGQRASIVRVTQGSLRSSSPDWDQIASMGKTVSETLAWFDEQPDILTDRFLPILKSDQQIKVAQERKGHVNGT